MTMETRGPWPDSAPAGMSSRRQFIRATSRFDGVRARSVVGLVAGVQMPAKTSDVVAQLGSEPAKLAVAQHPACAPELGPPVIQEQRKEAGSVFLGHVSRLDPE